ncbi:putative pyrroline-5-carboxylate reductase [Trypanosoma theileri]|uniref:Pyrroline-5-carboxylate reductase n=1 Tax=Trypanosoma theileri TaxID=67003 RepID=A0A1X0NTV2_9TRYP|nr:putative pyrroline-5-carboxylate reductase [Trypanosoma theileri]ORC87903.1 putative pyrroline-5-carboxylate reductase [Trypanosoma theileri]
MCECILGGLLRSGEYAAKSIAVYNRTEANVQRLCTQYGVRAGENASQVAANAKIVLIGVKPYSVCPVLESIRNSLKPDTIVVSVAAAITIAAMERAVGHPCKIVRTMPNVPTRVGAGLTSITPNSYVTPEETASVVKMFNTVGKTVEVTESQIHAVIGVAGSSPAYVFMFMEAMADAAVHGGLPRAQAYELAAQAVLGSAKLLQQQREENSSVSPAQLKDMVCSPGGTTIEAVRSLEKGGLRSTVIEAMIACMDKSKELEAKLN